MSNKLPNLKESIGRTLMASPEPHLQEIGVRMAIEAVKEETEILSRRIIKKIKN